MNNNYTKSEIARVSEGEANKPLTHRFRMTPKTLLTTLAATALLAATSINTPAQNVEPVLDLGPGTLGRDVLVNPFPNNPLPPGLFLAAYTPDYGYAVLDANLTQNPPIVGVIDRFPSRLNRLGFDPHSGALFAAGETLNPNTAWEVHRSLDGGVNWLPLISGWQLVAGLSASAQGVAADFSGNLFVCGRAAYDVRHGYWNKPIIRRSANGGASWENKVLSSKGGNFDNAADIQFVPSVGSKQGGIFAVGRVGNNWTVWRSRDAGVTWPVVHSWVPPKLGIAEATAITSDASGNIFVGGMGNGVNSARNWYVWASANGGTTWQDLGCPLLSGTDCIINGLAIDPAGENLLVVGTQSQFNWKMQRWSPGGGWSQAIFPYGNPGTSGPTSKAMGVATDATTGLFYVTGWANDPSGQSHATVLEVSH